MSWPTVSKGIFYEGFKKGASQGRTPGERSMQTVTAKGGKKDTVKGRMLYPAASPMTKESMRKPT